MSRQAIENGIAALQAGNIQQGEQLLRQGLMSREVSGSLRAVGYMWLATTSPNRDFQIQCYRAAVEADPSNAEARRRLDALQPPQVPLPPEPPPVAPMPPTAPPTSTQTAPPAQLPGTGKLTAQGASVPRMWEFGVEGGPNGIGTAFLVVRDGLLATARYVVGATTEVILISRDGRELEGKVVRSYPQHDLAFIRARINVPALRDFTPTGTVSPHTPLIADDYTERTEKAEVRLTRRKLAPGWMPTNFKDTLPRSYNGAPLMDDRDDLVGMLTRNADRNSGNLYGLHISLIRRKIEAFYEEERMQPSNIYCGTCGERSAAGAAKLHYCEHCGATFPRFRGTPLQPHPLNSQYYPTDMR
jgi:hypothetical protein